MEVLEKATQPPNPYTDATLLAAMKNAGREIEDDTLAEAMKQTGLSTPATRAEIIEKLIRTGYVQRERKQLRATKKGQALTAAWEQQLKEVEEGKRRAEEFYQSIVGFVRELVPRVTEGPALSPGQLAAVRQRQTGPKAIGSRRGIPRPAGLGSCPLCKEGDIVESANATAAAGSEPRPAHQPLVCPKCDQGRIIEGRRGFGCSRYREGCDFVVWKEISGKRLTERQIHALIGKRKTPLIRGFNGRSGSKFNARLSLDSQWKVVLEFPEPKQSSIGLDET